MDCSSSPGASQVNKLGQLNGVGKEKRLCGSQKIIHLWPVNPVRIYRLKYKYFKEGVSLGFLNLSNSLLWGRELSWAASLSSTHSQTEASAPAQTER